METKWIERSFDLAKTVQRWSEDNSTQVGAVIVSETNDFITMGWNGLPRGVQLSPERLERPTKYRYFEHAERNAIYNAARQQVSIENCAIFSTHFPCSDCARAIIQSGITEVYFYTTIKSEEWDESNKASREMFREAGVAIYLCGKRKGSNEWSILLKNDMPIWC